MKLETYSSDFYSVMETGSSSSAHEIIPLLFSAYKPKSVVDVGCGTGAFASEFLKLGVTDVVGYEGLWMKSLPTILPKDRYIYQDFKNALSSPRTFDLAICLEVAEHLEEVYARSLINSLCSLSEIVVFSAAIPNQGGNHHVNEQWPQYWNELFTEMGFSLIWDPRMEIWRNESIEACYRQNLLVFGRKKSPSEIPLISLVHPVLWTQAMAARKIPISNRMISKLPKFVFEFRRFILRLISKT